LLELLLMGNLTCGQLAGLWDAEGGNPVYAETAAKVAMAESSGDPDATGYDSNGTEDIGLWQINTSHGSLASYNEVANAQAAIKISDNGEDWYAWTTYTDGAYLAFCPSSLAAIPPATAPSIPASVPSVRKPHSSYRLPYRVAYHKGHPFALPREQFQSSYWRFPPVAPTAKSPVHKHNRTVNLVIEAGLVSAAGFGSITRKVRPMTRTMYDSTTLEAVPQDAEMVAYYPYGWGDQTESLKRFDPDKTVLIAIDNEGLYPDECGVLDVESGAATVADAPSWAKSRHEKGYKVTLYCD
jgi:hypothetical protein